MTPQTKKPPARGGAGGGFQNHPEQRHFTRKAPYANSANINKNDCVIVCTGSGGWDRAKSPFWFPGKKVVLPFGTDPASYAWSVVAEHDAMITGFGDLDRSRSLRSLQVFCLRLALFLSFMRLSMGRLLGSTLNAKRLYDRVDNEGTQRY